jgi:hypothetical protein
LQFGAATGVGHQVVLEIALAGAGQVQAGLGQPGQEVRG